MFGTPRGQYGSPASDTFAHFENYAKSAAGMFLLPDYPDSIDASVAFNNRWHRLLEFIDVGTKMNRARLGVGNNTPQNQSGDTAEFLIHRTPGKLNPNTLRYSEVLAGWIDDLSVAQLDLGANDPPTTVTTPQDVAPQANRPRLLYTADGAPLRDWFMEFQASRDSLDPYWTTQTGTPNYYLPGLPGSKPFRGLSFLSQEAPSGGGTPIVSLADTILRENPQDNGTAGSHRRLFEVGTRNEHLGTSGSSQLDPSIRHRMLSKMLGNYTPRSNAYVAFISVKLFRAVIDPTTGAVRIGGPVDVAAATTALPEYRGFFVIDRSRLEKGRELTSFVTYRKILQEP